MTGSKGSGSFSGVAVPAAERTLPPPPTLPGCSWSPRKVWRMEEMSLCLDGEVAAEEDEDEREGDRGGGEGEREGERDEGGGRDGDLLEEIAAAVGAGELPGGGGGGRDEDGAVALVAEVLLARGGGEVGGGWSGHGGARRSRRRRGLGFSCSSLLCLSLYGI